MTKKYKDHICDVISKGPFSDILEGQRLTLVTLWSAAVGVVSVENSLCFIILMAVSNCIMPELQVALASGVASRNPRPIGQGTLANVNGSGPSPDTGLAPDQWVSGEKQQWSDQ